MVKRRPIKPERLKNGETIGIIAPSGSFNKDNFKIGVKVLKDTGYKVKYNPMIFKECWSKPDFDEQRAHQINRMFEDKEVRAIFCAKGGYGSMRTIPHLDKKIIRKNPKIFVGYSDITALLSYIYSAVNMVVFHGPVVSGEISPKMNPNTFKYLFQMISSGEALGEIKSKSIKSLRPGKATGRLVGGNMSMFMNMIGTHHDMDTDGKIIFFEEVGEDKEIIDDYFVRLKLAGKLDRIKGIIFGKMTDCVEPSNISTLRSMLDDVLGDISVPVVYDFPSGHVGVSDLNVTIPLGVSVTVDADEAKVIINESGVR